MMRNRHLPFYAALAGAFVAGGVAALRVQPLLVAIIASNAFFATYISLTLTRIPRLSPATLRHSAARTDIPVAVIFTIALVAVTTALAALFIMLNATDAPGGLIALMLACAAVPLGWLTIHLMAAIHYAHLYWQPGQEDGAARGLDFPRTPEPGGLDFIYFSLVIGMTAQTSDVAITSRAMRKVNIFHATVSFFFNTVLVAAAVNAAVALSN